MSSLMASISTALSGLQTTQSLINISSDNISNAGTTGYTTKSGNVKSTVAGGTTMIRVEGYTRAADGAAWKSLMSATSEDGALSTSDSYLQQVQSILGSTDTSSSTSISQYVSAFASAWSSLQSEPESTTAQQAVITAGQDLSSAIQQTSSETEDLNRTIQADVSTDISDVNQYLQQISDYNAQIANLAAQSGGVGDTEDKRDQALLGLSKLMAISTNEQSNGTVSVYTTCGYELVNSTTAKTLSFDGTNIVSTGDPAISLNGTVTGGGIEAALNFIDTSTEAGSSTQNGVGTIAKVRSMLNMVVSSLTSSTSSFATTYNSSGIAANDFFYAGGATLDRTNIAVNPSIVDSSLALDTTNAVAVADTFNVSTMAFTSTTGQSFSNCSYESLASNVISYFQTQANAVSTQATAASSQKSTLTTDYSDKTGVNTDTELVKLTTLENAYNASAKVISVIQDMMAALEAAV